MRGPTTSRGDYNSRIQNDSFIWGVRGIPNDEQYKKMSVLDKGTLCFIWGISLFYTCLTEQLKISDSCSVRENINEKTIWSP